VTQFQEDLANESFVMFVVATYGEGEPTDNARDFIEWLEKKTEGPILSNTKFTVNDVKYLFL
jgi:NADPH-ferrihemoprotein reductase